MLELLCLFGAEERPTLLGESMADSGLTLRGVKVSWSFFSRTYLGTLVDRATRSLRQLIIAPISDVGEEDTCGGS